MKARGPKKEMTMNNASQTSQQTAGGSEPGENQAKSMPSPRPILKTED
jgi:hypothetical protein